MNIRDQRIDPWGIQVSTHPSQKKIQAVLGDYTLTSVFC